MVFRLAATCHNVLRSPKRSPKLERRAGPYAHDAERFVRTARTECLDWLLILGQRHLVRVLRVYVDHYNTQRPHRALGRHPPVAIRPSAPPPPMAAIQRRDHLGGLLHEYHTAAA
jgi:putative transposase